MVTMMKYNVELPEQIVSATKVHVASIFVFFIGDFCATWYDNRKTKGEFVIPFSNKATTEFHTFEWRR